jgi:hypothetical protein
LPGFDFFDRLAKPFRRSVEPSEDDIIAAVNDRIPVEEEPMLPGDADEAVRREDEFRRLLRRLEHQMEAMGVSTDEMLRSYDKPLNAIILLRFMEKYRKKASLAIRDRLIELGFVLVQSNVWVLPPSRTPQNLKSQEDIKAWVRSKLTRALRKDYQYVMPFVAVVDMRNVVAERHRVVRQPEARTIFTVMNRKDILPASFIYSYMKKKGFSLEGMIRSGDLVFLASAFADPETLEGLRQSQAYATSRIQKLMNSDGVSLSYIAGLHENELGGALDGIVQHPVDIARRLAIEAQYWERFLAGATGARRNGEAQGAKKNGGSE